MPHKYTPTHPSYITRERADILDLLERSATLTTIQLASAMGVSVQNVTRGLTLLSRHHLITRNQVSQRTIEWTISGLGSEALKNYTIQTNPDKD